MQSSAALETKHQIRQEALDTALETSTCRSAWVVQKYLERPLLYHGRKFDVRLFVVLETAPRSPLGLRLYVHREGYGRTSSEPYSLHATHNSMHLTNFAVQKVSPAAGKFERGNCVSFGDLDAYFGPKIGFLSAIVPRMHALVADAILALRPVLLETLATARAPHATFRDLVAFDLIIDAHGVPMMLEVNPSPGMEPQSPWHGQYLKRLLDDYVGLCCDARPPLQPDLHRPATDGRHVHQYMDDGWVLLLGEPSGRWREDEGDEAPRLRVRPCGQLLVLDVDREGQGGIGISIGGGGCGGCGGDDELPTGGYAAVPKAAGADLDSDEEVQPEPAASPMSAEDREAAALDAGTAQGAEIRAEIRYEIRAEIRAETYEHAYEHAPSVCDGVEDLGASLDFRDQRAWERHLAGADEVVGDVS
jgi:hypothetical protein